MKAIRPSLLRALLVLAVFHFQFATFAQGTAFTYQGRLNDDATPASGIYDLRFAIYDLASGGGQQGDAVTNLATAVSNGLFTVTLDFGNQFSGSARWLELAVRTNGGGEFTVLSPRQPLNPTPYAMFAPNAGTATTASSVSTNSIGAAGLQSDSVTTATVADGSLTAADINSASFSNTFWKVNGNAGTTAGAHFVGTTDGQPLELKVNNLRALRLEDNGDGSDSGTTPDGAPNVIGGSPANSVAAGVVGATIAGGGATNFTGAVRVNRVEADYSTIGGGMEHLIQTGSRFVTIGGGGGNIVQSNAHESTISGGGGNTVEFNADTATIAGGRLNTVQVNADFATVGGGSWNLIGTNSQFAFLGGGLSNYISAFSSYNTIAGGRNNFVGTNCSSNFIGGGAYNSISNDAFYSTIAGGSSNTVGYNASYAFAAGHRAKANHAGTFVWADSQDADFASSGTNQFLIRANRVGIGTTTPTNKLHVVGGATFASGNAGANQVVVWIPGSPSWSFTSDRNTKERVTPVDPVEVLERVGRLPIAEWSYQGYEQRHIGPMAQDFHAAFPFSSDATTLNSADLDGVALAAIQGLNQKVQTRDKNIAARILNLESENAELKARLEKLEQRLGDVSGRAR
ncbi:MAG TPA: tail fiber domain-containing protein [Verrucomicrobiae bacterium]|nr:tail fiber domain-containing protein [Verrucomicrobiae bacterium]